MIVMRLENEATTFIEEFAMRMRVETTVRIYGESAWVVSLEADWAPSRDQFAYISARRCVIDRRIQMISKSTLEIKHL